MRDEIASLSDDELERYRQSLLSRINQQDNDLRSRSDRFWREIDRGNYAFDTREQLSEITRQLDRADLLTGMDALLQRQLLVRSFGNGIKHEIQAEARRDNASQLEALKQDQLGTGQS